jgi:hypothetical protein
MTENNPAATVQAWLRAGAEVQSGLLLFSRFSKNRRFPALVRLNPAKYRPLLIEKLCSMAGIENRNPPTAPIPRRRFRDDFPFLRDPDCPSELKILAADKITAHDKYLRAHERLFDCTTLEECFSTAREAIDNFMENRAIFTELDYYREHRSILGKHRIFEYLRRFRKLKNSNIVELMTEQRRLRSAIWRINDEIKKGTKPHLLTEREYRRQQKETLLAEVTRLIDAYNKPCPR